MYETFSANRPVFRLTLPVTEEAAFDAVAGYMNSLIPEVELVIHQKPSGDLWIYYCQSANYLRTHDPGEMLLGNAPILLDTTTGEGFVTGTAEPTENYIAAYQRLRELRKLPAGGVSEGGAKNK